MTQNGADGGGESTLSLFTSILHKQEQEYIASASSSSKEDGSNKLKLFDLATRLIVLNLSHDNEGSNGVKIWTIILQFMQRHPDYAISTLKPEHYSTPLLSKNKKKRRQDGHHDDHGDGGQEQEVDEDGDGDEEKMVYWLIPRLLRCIIVQASSSTSSTPSKSTRSPTSSSSRSVNVNGRSNASRKVQGQIQQEEQEGQQEDNTVVHQGEKWIFDVVTHCLKVWFHRDEGGMQRRRELVHALIKLAQGRCF